MRRILFLFCVLALALSACRPGKSDPPAPPEPEEPPRLETLSVEIPRAGLDTETLARAVRELPEALKAALAEEGVEVGTVTVSAGSSPAAMAQALEEGGVDAAFFTAADFAALADPPELILAGGTLAPDLAADPAAWNREGEGQSLRSLGVPLLLCAGPTDYGRTLSARKTALTWEELSRARWGILTDTPAGRQGASLFLPEGHTVNGLPEAAAYEEAGDLFRAAAAGELDLLVLPGGLRMDWSSVWTLDPGETNARLDCPGLGRDGEIWEELPALAVSGKLYDMAAAVRPGSEVLAGEAFAQALAQAVNNSLKEDYPVFGSQLLYAPAEDGALAAQRTLSALR